MVIRLFLVLYGFLILETALPSSRFREDVREVYCSICLADDHDKVVVFHPCEHAICHQDFVDYVAYNRPTCVAVRCPMCNKNAEGSRKLQWDVEGARWQCVSVLAPTTIPNVMAYLKRKLPRAYLRTVQFFELLYIAKAVPLSFRVRDSLQAHLLFLTSIFAGKLFLENELVLRNLAEVEVFSVGEDE
ncbi:MAG: hypothetical protein OXT67_04655 [Zetaproteobacteria bacterium]|nr:hypothetical protein [Zetaproteobacteria bacterium]